MGRRKIRNGMTRMRALFPVKEEFLSDGEPCFGNGILFVY